VLEPGRLEMSRNSRRLLAGLVAMVLMAAGVFVALGLMPGLRTREPSNAIGGPFALTAGNGQKLTDQDFRGKWLLIYFGYTHCPDICPTTLAEISETLNLLDALASEVQPFFITIDPKRDTPEVVGDYVAAFNDRIIGLSGTPAEIATVAKAYRVYYAERADSVSNGESYFMEHTAFVYVVGPDGKYVTLLAPLQGQTPDGMAARLRDLIARTRSG
jgi:cytochrome oxidase Cu insertion factor (SCO1/SenC/PrrC family)